MPSIYDRWRLGLDEDDRPFCTQQEYDHELQVVDLIDQALSLSNDEDTEKLLNEARKCSQDWIEQAEMEGIERAPDYDPDDGEDCGS